MFTKSKISICLVVFMGSWTWAADQYVLTCVDDLAFGVIRVDAKALDFSKSVDALVAVAGKSMDERALSHFRNGIERSRRTIETDLASFQQAGGREIYAIFSLRDLPSFFLVFPADPGADQADMKAGIQALAQKSFHIDNLAIQSHGPLILAGKAQALEAVKALDGTANPLWASLLDKSPARPLRLVIVPNPMQSRVLKEMWPPIPGVPGMDQLGTFVQGCKWLTLGAQFVPSLAFEVALEMQTETLADEMMMFWKVALPLMTKPLGLDKPVLEQIPMRKQARTVTWTLNHTLAEQLIGQVVLGPVNKMASVVERVACATNMSAIGKAILLYENDHKDQCPRNLGILVTEAEVPQECLVCPESRAQDSFGYCGDGLDTSCEPTMILVYDKKGNHAEPGRNVLFLDSHVEWITEERFQELIVKVHAVRKERGLEAHVFE